MRAASVIAGAGMLALTAAGPASANGPILGTPPAPPPVFTPAPAPALPPPPPIAAPAPPPRLVSLYNWTGFYLGANLGGGWSSSDVTTTHTFAINNLAPVTASRSGTSSGSGIIGGGYFGANYQVPPWLGAGSGSWVVGVEADIQAADVSHTSSNCVQNAQGVVVGCGSRHSSLDDFGTVRGRLGYAFDNLLLYGTGGWAWSDTSSTLSVSSPFSQSLGHVSSSPDGWSAGGGIEYGFLPNWAVRAEYLHLQFDGIREAGSFSGTVGGVPASVTTNIKANLGVDIARIGLTYKFF